MFFGTLVDSSAASGQNTRRKIFVQEQDGLD